jgi:dTDP-4-dehydrorhamnose 3,5-epimerase
LSADNKRQMYIPVGCAHGFVAISDVAEVQYKQTDVYTPAAERTLAWNDVDVDVRWPIADPLLSARDARGHSLADYIQNPTFRYGDGG